MATSTAENKPPILHILVVGFHHKLGCQVEFSYPPLIAGTTGRNECPSGWKYLPTLALPDGSHNFVEDTVFFNLPSLLEPTESVYGISCYRQIPVEKLKNRTADVTRSTVQKSVCILARLPIYGYIEVKLSLIADAFFDQGDFDCTKLLVDAYQQLNKCLMDDEKGRSLRHFNVGLPLREIVLHWRHKTLILFKLFLLQRRVVFFGSPVRGMCALIVGIASLIPRLLEKGFQEVACVRTSRPLSPMPDFTDTIQRETAVATQAILTPPMYGNENIEQTETEDSTSDVGGDANNSVLVSVECCTTNDTASGTDTDLQTNYSNVTQQGQMSQVDSAESSTASGGALMDCHDRQNGQSTILSREASVDTLASNLATLCAINPDEYRAPITIFASGNLCLPYLSLPYMDLLSDPSVLSYVIGTSNVLFQQKRQLADVLIDIEAATLDTHDPELRRQLILNTEDLRFMDYLLKHVQAPKEDGEGSEYWIREQFQGYILALVRTAVATDATAKDNDHFNTYFMSAFKRTQCYTEWYDVRPDPEFFNALPAGHPFAGTLSVADMKLKIAQTMQNSESGRKINQAVNTTSRAVGGAISQAKGAFSNWWSSITTAPPVPMPPNNSATNDNILSDIAERTQKELLVTFQNRNDKDDLDMNGVSIHMATNNSSDENTCPSSPTPQVDSAEELEEGRELTDWTQQQLNGIVEIGKEAEVLDKNIAHQAPSTTNTQQKHENVQTASPNDEAQQHKTGEVFIV